MPRAIFSRLAVADLKAIDRYTIEVFGLRQAERYLQQMEAFCQHLAENPRSGRFLTPQRPGLRRAEHREHIVFYREMPEGISISRVLHARMLPERRSLR